RKARRARVHGRGAARRVAGRSLRPMSLTASAVLFGDQNVEAQNDAEPAGQAEAFPFVASVSGTAQQVNVYVRSTATLRVALYSDASGRPGSLLTSGTTTPAAAP